jgi:LPXTG-motif cell wall-anchored protein
VSALSVRIRDRDRPRSFRMPLWPVPPLIALAGGAVALRFQSMTDLAIALGLAVLALLGYLVVRRRSATPTEP